jgi:CRISPR-associated endonuclease Csn1
MRETVWGFDLGTTSIGFAVVQVDAGAGSGEILRTGVRIFPEGITEKELEPRNKRRREKRLLRRQVRRRRVRRVTLSRRFHELGLLPRFGSPDWQVLMDTDPYELRSKALAEALAPWEVGRALYHLAQRRGFKSARKTIESASSEDAEESGKVKEALSQLQQELDGKTLGQHLSHQEKKRGRYLGRDMVQEEFDRIWEAQAKHHPELMTEEVCLEIRGLVFRQRPIFWRASTLGSCRLEPGSRLCLKSSWEGQQFLLLQELNSLRLEGESTGLPAEEREVLLEQLMEKGELGWGGCRKLLKPFWQKSGIPLRSKFNFELGGKTRLAGNRTEKLIREALGPSWKDYPRLTQLREQVASMLWEVDYRQVGEGKSEKILIRSDEDTRSRRAELQQRLQTEWGLPAQAAERLTTTPLPAGWLSHSEAAVRRLLPHLKAGKLYSEACDLEYPDHRDVQGEGLDRLPSSQEGLRDIRNPSVRRALNELRKVVNNLIRKYGKPDRIRVELARELKMPGSARRDYQNQTTKRQKERDQARKHLEDMGYPANRSSIEKWMLWQECEQRCPYTDEPICAEALFQEGRFEVEHILPYSKTLDNGLMNKTLGQREFNLRKGNRIPCEAFRQEGEEAWKGFVRRIKNSKLPDAKKRRLMARSIEEVHGDDFSERQLRDTAYIAVEARDFLMKLFVKEPGKALPVESSNGMVTAQLRYLWGMNTILGPSGKKNREDHRHHAVDALAVALVSRGMVKRMSDLSQHWLRGIRTEFPPPWEGFRQQAEESVGAIIVSHKVQAKVQGKLHEETIYGSPSRGQGGPEDQQVYSRKVTLASLSESQLKQLKNGKLSVAWDAGGRLQRLLLEHLERHNDFSTQLPGFELPDGTLRLVKRIKLLENRKSSLMADLRGDGSAWGIKKENHHMVVYGDADGKVAFRVVSRHDAALRHSRKKPVIEREAPPGFQFKMSLVSRDTITFVNEDGKLEYCVVQSIWDNGQLVLDRHSETKSNLPKRNIRSLMRLGLEKVSVDPIGEIRPKND